MAKILIVDDDATLLQIAGKIAVNAGHTVLLASNGREAQEILKSSTFDLIVTDANMPGMSGFNLVQMVKTGLQQPPPRTLMLTGRNTRADVQRALDCGVDGYIVKPLNIKVFAEKIAALLKTTAPESAKLMKADGICISAVGGIELEIKALSETGLTAHSAQDLKLNLSLEIAGSPLKEIGIPSCEVIVTSCRREENAFSYVVQLYFVGLHEEQLAKIRAWSKRAKAA